MTEPGRVQSVTGAALRVQRFLAAWERFRPVGIEGNGEVLMSWPGTDLPSLRRSDLRALIEHAELEADRA